MECFCAACCGICEDTALQLIINNQLYLPTEGQAGPALVDERVYVPLRLVSESLGHQVQWLPSQRLVAIWTEEPANVVETDSGEVAAEDGPITITVDDTLLSADADTGAALYCGRRVHNGAAAVGWRGVGL